MNSDQLQGQWRTLKGEIRSWWGNLTDDDIESIGGNKDRLIGVIQQKYGYMRDEAERIVDQRLDEYSARSQPGVGESLRYKAQEMGSTLRDTALNLKEKTGELVSQEKVQKLGSDVVALIRRYPVPSLLIGFGIGFLLARRPRR